MKVILMRVLNSLVLILIFIAQGFSQYISSVYTPDTSDVIEIDSTDLGFQIAQEIKAEDLQAHLFVIASDDYQGRETGQPGIEKAANYISNHLDGLNYPKIGIENSYYQKMGLTFTSWKENEMYVNGNRFKHLWDYLAFQNRNESLPDFTTDEVVYLGFGIDDPEYSDYKKNNVKDKVILIYNGEPVNKDGKSHITNSKELSDWSGSVDKKLKVAKEKGVKLVLIIEEDIKALLMKNRSQLMGRQTDFSDGTFNNPYAKR